MAGVTVDAGPLIAIEREAGEVKRWLSNVASKRFLPTVPTVVVAEVWRGGARSANVARFLGKVEIVPLDEHLARAAGNLLAVTGSSSTIDAVVVVTAYSRGEPVLTADVKDLAQLAQAVGVELLEL